MKKEFISCVLFGVACLCVAVIFATFWIRDISNFLPLSYAVWVIVGIALLPCFLMSSMFFSNLLHQKRIAYPVVSDDVTLIICVHNEENTIQRAISCVTKQEYCGQINVLVVDNCSTDNTKKIVMRFCRKKYNNCKIKYTYCGIKGKANALNHALKLVKTAYFITVDADTNLEKNAVQQIVNHIVSRKCACVAGNLFVENANTNLITKMQNYDYMLSIAAVKRYQGSYNTTLVAQGAFSAYETQAVQDIGGFTDCLGEDIVLTYKLLKFGRISSYEPTAVGYTTVPQTLKALYNQRKRWAIGMMEGFSAVKPWKQPSLYTRFFCIVNILIIYLDLAFIFGFIPGILLAVFGFYFFVGFLTGVTLLFSLLMFSSVYIYQKKLNIPFKNNAPGLICFYLIFQIIQSSAALHGYVTTLFKGKEDWK